MRHVIRDFKRGQKYETSITIYLKKDKYIHNCNRKDAAKNDVPNNK